MGGSKNEIGGSLGCTGERKILNVSRGCSYVGKRTRIDGQCAWLDKILQHSFRNAELYSEPGSVDACIWRRPVLCRIEFRKVVQ